MPFFGSNGAVSLDAFLGDDHDSLWPDTVKATVFLTVPSGADPGVQPSVGSFSPVLLDNDSTTWPDANTSTNRKANGVPIVFPTATADWGELTGYGLLWPDDSVLWYGGLVTPVTVLSGQTKQFAVGAFVLRGF